MNRYETVRLILLVVLVASLGVAAATVGLAAQGEGSNAATAVPGDALDGFEVGQTEGTGQAATDLLDGILASKGEGTGQAATGANGGFHASKQGGTGSSPP